MTEPTTSSTLVSKLRGVLQSYGKPNAVWVEYDRLIVLHLTEMECEWSGMRTVPVYSILSVISKCGWEIHSYVDDKPYSFILTPV